MSITRKTLSFERNKGTFEMPRTWARDQRISRKARGLLGELLSHEPGFKVTQATLLAKGPEGKDALKTAMDELEANGYLARSRSRSSKGTFEVDYELTDPFDRAVDNSASGASAATADNPLRSGFPTAGKSAPLRRDSSTKEKDYTPSSNTPHLGAVDNSQGDDDQLPLPIQFPTPAKAAAFHPTAIDRAQLAASVGHLFVDSGISDDQLHSIAMTILGRATTHVANPTAYVVKAIRNDWAEWQKYAFELQADLTSRGGNPF